MRQEMTIRQEGARVRLIVGGRLIADLAPEAARELAALLRHQAGKAEEIVQRERIVFDQAILLRVGAPIGLIHDPHLRHQAASEAAWNSDLRRYLPGGVKSQEVFGTPTVLQFPPRKAV